MTKKRRMVSVSIMCLLILFPLTACSNASNFETGTLELASEKIINITNEKISTRQFSSIEEASAEESIVSAYAYFLYDYAGGFLVSDSPLCFSLAYIDEDDMPELLVCNGNKASDSIFVYKYDAYSNDVILVGGFGGYGSMVYYPQNNLIEDSYIDTGIETMSYYSIDNMNLVTLSYLQHDMDRGLFYIDNMECDKADYERKMHEFSSLADSCFISCDAMTRYSSCCNNSETIENAILNYFR